MNSILLEKVIYESKNYDYKSKEYDYESKLHSIIKLKISLKELRRQVFFIFQSPLPTIRLGNIGFRFLDLDLLFKFQHSVCVWIKFTSYIIFGRQQREMKECC